MFFKKQLFGYDKSDVDQIIKKLTDENQRLKNIIVRQEKNINELSDELSRMKEKENNIQKSLIDAKNLAKEIVNESEEYASYTKEEAKKNSRRIFNNFEKNFNELVAVKRDIVDLELKLKEEIREKIIFYLNQLDDIDVFGERLDAKFIQIEDRIEQMKLEFSDDYSAYQKESEVEEIPVYTFQTD
ncbi:DivIVA domain-containing protein [Streptococcus sp. CSL10205-OR2]|uniref:DivIVA domain-containing protein n=1 Tax=Streptococcus sp. CSL10205-OR2 TaxID=2980558 RepID=UPI0021DA1EC0|nr:DivIVA domain-containing protein [Streptococcus sp. CSL10205-OR2]MCU9533649.1 DivIVA domain-containing protein [Streptococcus sp. CSL10205-OR2]